MNNDILQSERDERATDVRVFRNSGLERPQLDRPDVDVNAVNASGDTALHQAVAHDHAAVVEVLLQRVDVEVNAKNALGTTALARAVQNRSEQIVDLLLQRPDVDVNRVDTHRWTPLHHSALARSPAITARLLAHPRTNTEITNRPFQQTAVEVALEAGDDDTAQLLRDAAPTHSFGDVLSAQDDYVEQVLPTGAEPIPPLPYDRATWPRPLPDP